MEVALTLSCLHWMLMSPQVLAAAFETFEEDGDVDELVETLIVFHRQKLSSKGTSAQHPDVMTVTDSDWCD